MSMLWRFHGGRGRNRAELCPNPTDNGHTQTHKSSKFPAFAWFTTTWMYMYVGLPLYVSCTWMLCVHGSAWKNGSCQKFPFQKGFAAYAESNGCAPTHGDAGGVTRGLDALANDHDEWRVWEGIWFEKRTKHTTSVSAWPHNMMKTRFHTYLPVCVFDRE